MATELERPKTPLSMVVIGVVVAAFVGLILLRMIIGFVITVTKIGIAVAVIAAIVVVINRAVGDDDT
jgi:hypothetical protein